jgi:Fe-Mn family superoxide dismutase
MSSRRDFIKKTALVTAGTLAASQIPAVIVNSVQNIGDETAQFELPKLGYEYNALEPYIDAKTMEIHHSKHHQAYVDKLNKALAENKVNKISLEDLVKNISKYPVGVRNNAGGHWNHSEFWKMMKAPQTAILNGDPTKKMGVMPVPNGTLADAIKESFGSTDEMKNKFNDAAKSVFGSGWAWLIVNKDKKLEIGTTPNQDNPLMDLSPFKGTPVLALDVWEHAYYLKHMNLRADYINDWWNVVNWDHCTKCYMDAMK